MFNNSSDKTKIVEKSTESTSNIGKGATITGDIETHGNIRVEGMVKGNITSKSKIAQGPSSYVEGKVLALNAEIEGEIKGSVEVAELLILRPTAIIHGDITTNKLIVESGASFNGTCKMGITIKEIKLAEEKNGITGQPTAKKEEKLFEKPTPQQSESKPI
jgi:cytoskeletal protein CcmA (bactofilin family)